MYETNSFLSVKGATLEYEGKGNIVETIVSPDLSETLKFINKVDLGKKITFPLKNIAVGEYPFYAVISNENNFNNSEILNNHVHLNIEKDVKKTNEKNYELSFESQNKTKITVENNPLKSGAILKIALPYEYQQASKIEQLFISITNEFGKNIAGGYIKDVNNSTYNVLLVSFIAPYDLNKYKINIQPFASQNNKFQQAKFLFSLPQIYK